MGLCFPPCENLDRLKRRINALPPELREDATQEAWLAHLAGADPHQAVWAMENRDRRFQDFHAQLTEENSDKLATPEQPKSADVSVRAMHRNSPVKVA